MFIAVVHGHEQKAQAGCSEPPPWRFRAEGVKWRGEEAMAQREKKGSIFYSMISSWPIHLQHVNVAAGGVVTIVE